MQVQNVLRESVPEFDWESTPLWRGMTVFELSGMWELRALCSNGQFQLVMLHVCYEYVACMSARVGTHMGA